MTQKFYNKSRATKKPNAHIECEREAGEAYRYGLFGDDRVTDRMVKAIYPSKANWWIEHYVTAYNGILDAEAEA